MSDPREAIRQTILATIEAHHHKHGPIMLPADMPPLADAIMARLDALQLGRFASFGFCRPAGARAKPIEHIAGPTLTAAEAGIPEGSR